MQVLDNLLIKVCNSIQGMKCFTRAQEKFCCQNFLCIDASFFSLTGSPSCSLLSSTGLQGTVKSHLQELNVLLTIIK